MNWKNILKNNNYTIKLIENGVVVYDKDNNRMNDKPFSSRSKANNYIKNLLADKKDESQAHSTETQFKEMPNKPPEEINVQPPKEEPKNRLDKYPNLKPQGEKYPNLKLNANPPTKTTTIKDVLRFKKMEDPQQKEIRLRKELASLRTTNANNDRKITPSRDFSVGGLPPDTTHKAKRNSADTPDVIQLPAKKRKRTENKW